MSFYYNDLNRTIKISLKEDGEVYIDNLRIPGLAIHMWDTLINHLTSGKPLSYLAEENPVYQRRMNEAAIIAKSLRPKTL